VEEISAFIRATNREVVTSTESEWEETMSDGWDAPEVNTMMHWVS